MSGPASPSLGRLAPGRVALLARARRPRRCCSGKEKVELYRLRSYREPTPDDLTKNLADTLKQMNGRTTVLEEARALLYSWSGWPVLDRIVEESSEVQIYLTGGVLRDIFLKSTQAPRDFDFFIGGKEPQLVLEQLSQHGQLATGPFGSPRWYPDQDERHADTVPIPSFYNGLWRCEDIIDVLNQFDFTCNALALDVRTGQFFDPQNGSRAISRRLMQAVRFDYPEEPILPGQVLTRNAVLWFRILHYAAARGLKIESVTLRWLRNHARYRKQATQFEAAFFPLHPAYLDPVN
jgi:hypothetical protein